MMCVCVSITQQLSQVPVSLPNEQLSLQVSSVSFPLELRVSVQLASLRLDVVVQFKKNIYSWWWWVKQNSVYQSLLSAGVS